MNKLSAQNQKRLAVLKGVAHKIIFLLDELYKLEVARQKDSAKYKEYFEYLKMMIEYYEIKVYEEIPTEDCIHIIEHLNKELSELSVKHHMEAIIKQKNAKRDDRVIRRIDAILEDKITSDYAYFSRQYNETIKPTFVGGKMWTIIYGELLMSFLSFIQESLGDKITERVRPELLKAKYEVASINKTVENTLIESNFEIPTTLIQSSEFISSLFSISKEGYQSLKNLQGKRISEAQIKEILQISDDYTNPKNIIAHALRQSLMRAGFVMMDEKDLIDLNTKFTNDEVSLSPNHISRAVVLEAFRKSRADRERDVKVRLANEAKK